MPDSHTEKLAKLKVAFEDAVCAWLLWDEMRHRGVADRLQKEARADALRRSFGAWGYSSDE